MTSDKSAFGYAVGDFGINLYFISTMTWLMAFYTDVVGLAPFVVAGIFFVARLIDAFTDPLIGLLAERTQSRWGRMRPWLLFGTLPLGFIAVLTFSSPDTDMNGKIIWAYVTYVLFGVIYTVVTIPYSALTASISPDYDFRTKLSTQRMACAFGGGWIVSVGAQPFVGMFGEDQTLGWQVLLAIFALIASGVLFISFWTTEEEVLPREGQKITLKQSVSSVFSNPPLLIVIGIFCCGMFSFTVRQSLAFYYFKYNVGQPDLVPFFFASTLGLMIVGLAVVPSIASRFGKDGALFIGAGITILSSFGFYFTEPTSVGWVFLWGILVALGGTPIAVMGWAMMPDTIEYAEEKLGVRADGSVYSMSSLFQKIAKAVGGSGVALGLGVVGYVANQPQTLETLNGIQTMFTLAPAAIMVPLIALAWFYPLDKKMPDHLRGQLGR